MARSREQRRAPPRMAETTGLRIPVTSAMNVRHSEGYNPSPEGPRLLRPGFHPVSAYLADLFSVLMAPFWLNCPGLGQFFPRTRPRGVWRIRIVGEGRTETG